MTGHAAAGPARARRRESLATRAERAREVVEEIAGAFGAAVLLGDGSVDRAALGARVFASAADRERLESFTHPRIRARIRAELEAARARGVERIEPYQMVDEDVTFRLPVELRRELALAESQA